MTLGVPGHLRLLRGVVGRAVVLGRCTATYCTVRLGRRLRLRVVPGTWPRVAGSAGLAPRMLLTQLPAAGMGPAGAVRAACPLGMYRRSTVPTWAVVAAPRLRNAALRTARLQHNRPGWAGVPHCGHGCICTYLCALWAGTGCQPPGLCAPVALLATTNSVPHGGSVAGTCRSLPNSEISVQSEFQIELVLPSKLQCMSHSVANMFTTRNPQTSFLEPFIS